MDKHYSQLKADTRTHWRRRAKEELERRGQPLPPGFRESEPGDGDLNPPDAYRVARRAGCLAAVALRGLAGTWEHKQEEELVGRLQTWVESSPLLFEFEQEEVDTINVAPGKLDEKQMVNACWRWEGAAVLVASLGRVELPSHDRPVNLKACGDGAGLFMPEDQLASHLRSAAFAPDFDRFGYANQALAINWRMREFTQAEQKPIDFAAFARGVQWAEFNLKGVPLANGDLAIGGKPIIDAEPDGISATASIATERHLAANWLIGWTELYSEVENPT
jgi:hypothetical protein